jgi:hypothetical protein
LFITFFISNSGKKAKITGVRAIDKIGESLAMLAGAILQSVSETSRDTVDFIIKGQVQIKIQNKPYLTFEGIVLILDILRDTKLACIYIAIKKDNMQPR